MICEICNNNTNRKSSRFCSRKCSGIYKTKISGRIPELELRNDYNNGMSWNELSIKYNVSLATIKKYLNKYNIQYKSDFDFVGLRFGSLIVKSKSYIKSTKQYWNCVCDCGYEYNVTTSSLLKNKNISCDTCRRLNSREDSLIKTTVWNKYINGAKTRKIDFTITKEYVVKLFELQNRKCALSGIDINFSPSQGKKLRKSTTASLDRIDSSKGYIEGNVQWVHKTVNKMKMNLDEDEFLDWCKRIVNNEN